MMPPFAVFPTKRIAYFVEVSLYFILSSTTSYINLPPRICQLNFICMITGEKNRAHNCLTVSNLKLDDVFSDIFGKSSRSITEQILQHPGEYFDVAPFVHGRCKTPIEEIQAAVDGAVSNEQAVKLRQCLSHIDELEMHKTEIEREILRLSEKYEDALSLIRTVPGFDKNPMTAIQMLSEIGGDMSVFPTAKNLVS